MQTDALKNGATGIKRAFVFGFGMLLGLVAFVLIGSALGWIQPIWWGGEALLVPLIFGLLFVLVGAFPLYGIARILLGARTASVGDYWAVGLLSGFGVFAAVDPLAVMLRDLTPWQTLSPPAAVMLGLLISGVASVLLAAMVVRLARQLSALR